MPKKSAGELAMGALQVGRLRLEAPANLAEPERVLFDQVVASVPNGFFGQEDQPLLAAYARALHQNELAGRALAAGSTDAHWIALATASVQSITQLATRLRLGPRARDPSHRRRQGNALRPQNSIKPWNDNCDEERHFSNLQQTDDHDAIQHVNDATLISATDKLEFCGTVQHAADSEFRTVRNSEKAAKKPAACPISTMRPPTREELIEAGKKYSGPRNGGDNFSAPDSTAPR